MMSRQNISSGTRWEAICRVHGKFFGYVRPASTMVEVSKLIDPGQLIEVEAFVTE